jgi:hypothetical protein
MSRFLGTDEGRARIVRALYLVGWPLLIVGLTVVLAAILYIGILNEELQQQSFVAETRSQFLTAAELDQRRARLHAWPVLFAGGGLVAAGLALLLIRRRLENQ